ncbi:MAG: hypothetical protein JWP45_1868 [Mucilaginibacter sp.]|nr:hypothetical protein [Mucilaginibacter sp.]
MLVSFCVNAQTQPVVTPTQPFGKIDKADLEMKSCDFEKDANAEILFDKGSIYFSPDYDLILERHVRTKIFNDKGNDEANVRIEYFGGDRSEYITGVQAETINLNNGNIEITKVDKKLIYTQTVDKLRTALVFSFPNVKPGSIVEFKYTLTAQSVSDFPDWYFQAHIPTRYSELATVVPNILYYKKLEMVNHPFVKNTDDIRSMANIPSLHDEPYMSSRKDNLDHILYQLGSINAGALSKSFSDTWTKVGEEEIDFDDFGGQLRRKLEGEELIVNKAKSMKSNDEKIAYIFNEVKNNMKWDDHDERYTNDGTVKAWQKKIGNSTEVNLILYHLLFKAGIDAYPMLVSTKKNGKVNPAFTSRYQFNRTVAYIPVDSNRNYILDATGKYNIYNETPASLLNGYGFYMDKENKKYELVFLQRTSPVRQVTMISADIKPDGKISGTAQLNSFSYNRINAVTRYKTDGEKKYIDYLRDDNNNLKISSIKFENMEVDTLPLTQNITFNQDLTGSDDNYIYFNPNLFTSQHDNPFLNENRYTTIDFGYRGNYYINGIYKEPAGYKVDAMPKSINMSMPDKSIVFKRIVVEQDGSILVRYTIDYNQSVYFKENYPELHEFFKKMHEMLNEQIVLKKS